MLLCLGGSRLTAGCCVCPPWERAFTAPLAQGGDNIARDQQRRFTNTSGVTYSAALGVVLVTTSVSAAVLCRIAVDLPLAWD